MRTEDVRGSSRLEAARRAAEEARRRAEEARRQEAAGKAAEAARAAAAAEAEPPQRRTPSAPVPDGPADHNERRVSPSPFGSSASATRVLAPAGPTYAAFQLSSVEVRADAPLAAPHADAALTPRTSSAEDRAELADLGRRLREHGLEPVFVQHALREARLAQIAREKTSIEAVDPTGLLKHGLSLEPAAQRVLDHYILNVDSIYSGLSPIDRERAGLLAWIQEVKAKGTVREGLALQSRAAALDLEKARLEREQALASGAPPDVIAAWEVRITAARQALEGDPAAGSALVDRLRAAERAYALASSQLERQQGELKQALDDYHARLRAQLPVAEGTIGEFRRELDLSTSAPELDRALADLTAILPQATPEQMEAALERIKGMPNGDVVFGRLMQVDALGVDPRVDVYQRRRIGVPTGLERIFPDLLVNTALLGLPSFVENQRILAAPGASPALLGEARLGLALDYVGFALTLAGPLFKGVRTVLRGGRTTVDFAPEMRSALRAAGYADEAIDQLAVRVGRAGAENGALADVLLSGSPVEAAGLVEGWGEAAREAGSAGERAVLAARHDPLRNGALSFRGANAAGARYYGATRPVTAEDVVDVVKTLEGQGAEHITILSGRHGGQDGEFFDRGLKELRFLLEDLKNVKGPRVSVLDVNMVSKAELERLTGHIYAAWCWSQDSELWLDILPIAP